MTAAHELVVAAADEAQHQADQFRKTVTVASERTQKAAENALVAMNEADEHSNSMIACVTETRTT